MCKHAGHISNKCLYIWCSGVSNWYKHGRGFVLSRATACSTCLLLPMNVAGARAHMLLLQKRVILISELIADAQQGVEMSTKVYLLQLQKQPCHCCRHMCHSCNSNCDTGACMTDL